MVVARTPEQSKAINNMKGPLIIISASGMATGGRVLHHLKHRLPNSDTTVLLAGYQAEGTRGRTLQDGAKEIKMLGEVIPVRAKVKVLDGFSAHADQGEILRWLGTFPKAPKLTYVVHGEPAGAQALADVIRERLKWNVEIAKYSGESDAGVDFLCRVRPACRHFMGNAQSGTRAETMLDPICDMTVEPAKRCRQVRLRWRDLLFLQRPLSEVISKRSGEVSRRRQGSADFEASSAGAHQHHAHHLESKPEIPGAIYTCPMDPEVRQQGAGACPKCGMALEPLDIAAALTKTEYLCPMHPEVVRDAPGSCPICGMALEARTVTLTEEKNPELEDMTRRFWIGVALSLPVLLVAMSDMLPGQPLHRYRFTARANLVSISAWRRRWCSGAAGRFFSAPGRRSSIAASNMFTLIGIGVGTAYRATASLRRCFPELFPASLRGHGGEVGVYFEAAAVITTLVLLGQVLELRARSKHQRRHPALLGLAPKTARRVGADGSERGCSVGAGQSGRSLARASRRKDSRRWHRHRRAKLGRRIDGHRRADSRRESLPNSKVTGGTVNGTGSFLMRAERVGSDTLLAQIVRMVSEAQRSRAPIQKLADLVSAYFVPAVVAVAVVTFIIWAMVGAGTAFGLRFGQCGGGADHRLSLRPRAWRRRCRSWSAPAAAPRPEC